MSNERMPVLTENQANLDWKSATYEIGLKRVGNNSSVTIEHQLKGVPSLLDAVSDRRASYVTEVRSPRSLYSHETSRNESEYQVPWDDADVVEDQTFVLGGVVSHGAADIDTTDLHDFFSSDDRTTVALPEGWWAARASVRRLNPILKSLITFLSDDAADEGVMRVEEGEAGGAPKFNVWLSPKLYEAVHDPENRSLRIAAAIGVFARLPFSSMNVDGPLSKHPVTKELLALLREADVPDWQDDPQDFDAALAVTTLERFETASAGEAASDDSDDEVDE